MLYNTVMAKMLDCYIDLFRRQSQLKRIFLKQTNLCFAQPMFLFMLRQEASIRSHVGRSVGLSVGLQNILIF
jgi:hypothetical protein